jgi:hypothetical protein
MVTYQNPLLSIGLFAQRTFPKNLPSCRQYSSCPFQVLGLNSKRTGKLTTDRLDDGAITYNQVRVAFRELAFKYHPDTSSSGDTDKEFIRMKNAFEAIEEGDDGIARIRDDNHGHDHDDSRIRDEKEYNAFPDEFLHPSVNPQILHEVADVANKMNPGGLDKRGMWQYANMISKMASSDLPPLRVEGGDDANNGSGTGNRRRRRRK